MIYHIPNAATGHLKSATYHIPVEYTVRKALHAADINPEQWEHWSSLYYCVCMPVCDLAITLIHDAVDLLKPTKLWRFNLKHGAKEALKEGEKYESLLMDVGKHNVYGDRRQFFMDYMDAWLDSINKDVVIFRECISSYLLKIGIDGERNKLQTSVFLAYIVADYSVHLWDLFWNICKQKTGQDYSIMFRMGRLERMVRNWYDVVCVFDPKNEIDLDKDKNCVNAFRVIQYKCTQSDLINKAGNEALSLNDDVMQSIREMEEKELPESERHAEGEKLEFV